MGEKKVEKGDDIVLTLDRFRQLQTMKTEELSQLPTHEKVIWLRWIIENNTPSVATGSNDLIVNRDNLISDAMEQFSKMTYPRRVSL